MRSWNRASVKRREASSARVASAGRAVDGCALAGTYTRSPPPETRLRLPGAVRGCKTSVGGQFSLGRDSRNRADGAISGRDTHAGR